MLSTMLIKNAGDQEANRLPSNPPDRPQPTIVARAATAPKARGKTRSNSLAARGYLRFDPRFYLTFGFSSGRGHTEFPVFNEAFAEVNLTSKP